MSELPDGWCEHIDAWVDERGKEYVDQVNKLWKEEIDAFYAHVPGGEPTASDPRHGTVRKVSTSLAHTDLQIQIHPPSNPPTSLAHALFEDEMMTEAARIAEGPSRMQHVLDVMWERAGTAADPKLARMRAHCEDKASRLFRRFFADE